MSEKLSIALIRGDGIGVDVANAAVAIVDAAVAKSGLPALTYKEINAGAGYFKETGRDIEPGGEARAGEFDAIFLGAIGLPSVRHEDGTEIAPHLRLRDRYGLYAGVRPVQRAAAAGRPARRRDRHGNPSRVDRRPVLLRRHARASEHCQQRRGP